jgi:hypothetical protein
MRWPAGLLLLIAAAVSASAPSHAQTQVPSGSVRIILQYVVNPKDDNAKKGVTAWIQAFKNNLRYLLADFTSDASSSNPSITVRLTSKDVDDFDPDTLKDSFQSQSSLQVISTVSWYTGTSTIVDNDIYLGDFKGSLGRPYLHMQQKVEPSGYLVTRDAFAAVTLYAYAMAIANAMPEDASRYLVCRILDRANLYRNEGLDTDTKNRLADMFKAISFELEQRACGGKK